MVSWVLIWNICQKVHNHLKVCGCEQTEYKWKVNMFRLVELIDFFNPSFQIHYFDLQDFKITVEMPNKGLIYTSITPLII